jgi:hypothetical protein
MELPFGFFEFFERLANQSIACAGSGHCHQILSWQFPFCLAFWGVNPRILFQSKNPFSSFDTLRQRDDIEKE